MQADFLFNPVSKAERLVCFPSANRIAVVRKQTQCNIIDFRLEPPKKLFEWIDFQETVTCIAPSPTKSSTFYCSIKSGKTYIWDSNRREKVCIIESNSFIRTLACLRNPGDNVDGESDYLAVGGELLKVYHQGKVTVMEEYPDNSHHISILWMKNRSRLVSLKDDGSLILFDASTGLEQARAKVNLGYSLRTDMNITLALSSTIIESIEYISVPCKSPKIFICDSHLSEKIAISDTNGLCPYFSKFIDTETIVIGYSDSSVIQIYQIDVQNCDSILLLSVETHIVHRFMDCSCKGIFLISGSELYYSNKNLLKNSMEVTQKKQTNIDSKLIDDEAEECSESSFEGEAYTENNTYMIDSINKNPVDRLDDSGDSCIVYSKDNSSCDGTTQDNVLKREEPPDVMQIRGRYPRTLHPYVSLGQTPYDSGSQYLAFNLYGCVVKQGEQIAVHFHDKGKTPKKLGERNGVCLASLGENGVLLGSSTSLFYKSFLSFGTNTDWSAHFEPSEEIHLLTVGTRNVVVSTSQYLRMYTHSGLEFAVVCHVHRAICLTMTSSCFSNVARDLCAIAYEVQEQQLELRIVDTTSSKLLHKVPVNVEALSWMGWSSDGFFYIVDNRGRISMLSTVFGGSWLPMLDPSLSIDDVGKYWIWGITEDSFLGHRLHAEEGDYPTFGSVRTEYVKFQMPLSRTGGEKQRIQREWIMRNTSKINEIKANAKSYSADIAEWDIKIDQVLLDSFRSYIQEDMSAKALEIACCFELQATMDEAMLFSHNNERSGLLKKLQQLRMLRHKRKRISDLPDPGDEITERDKDLLFRRMLYQERKKKASEKKLHASSEAQSDSQQEGVSRVCNNAALSVTTSDCAQVPVDHFTLDNKPQNIQSKYFGKSL